MTAPAWLRMWRRPGEPTDAKEALAAALANRSEVRDLVERADRHRQHNHLAERIEAALSQEARRRKRTKRKKPS